MKLGGTRGSWCHGGDDSGAPAPGVMGFSWSHGIGKSHVETEDMPHGRAAIPPAVWCFPSPCRALPPTPAAGWELWEGDMAVPGGVAGGCVVGKGGWGGGASALRGVPLALSPRPVKH